MIALPHVRERVLIKTYGHVQRSLFDLSASARHASIRLPFFETEQLRNDLAEACNDVLRDIRSTQAWHLVP